MSTGFGAGLIVGLARVFAIQVALVVAAAGAYIAWTGTPDRAVLWGAVYGASVSLSTTLLLWWRDRRAARRQDSSANRSGDVTSGDVTRRVVLDFYLPAMERLGWVIVLLGLGLATGWFSALPLLSGFLVGQAAAFAAGVAGLLKDSKF
jgi:hypothetical protein